MTIQIHDSHLIIGQLIELSRDTPLLEIIGYEPCELKLKRTLENIVSLEQIRWKGFRLVKVAESKEGWMFIAENEDLGIRDLRVK